MKVLNQGLETEDVAVSCGNFRYVVMFYHYDCGGRVIDSKTDSPCIDLRELNFDEHSKYIVEHAYCDKCSSQGVARFLDDIGRPYKKNALSRAELTALRETTWVNELPDNWWLRVCFGYARFERDPFSH